VIKLLIVIPTLDQSGAEKQFALLASGLPRDEFETQVIALSRGGPFEKVLREHQVPVKILKKQGRLDLKNLLQVRNEIRSSRPDVVLSCLFAANSTIRLATLGMKPRPITIVSERCVDSWKSGWQRQLDRLLIPRTDRLVGNSESVKQFYQELGLPEEKLSVIPNGVSVPPLPRQTRAELLMEFGLPPETRLIAYAGRLAPQKGIPHLLWGMQLLRQSNPETCLLILGDGPERQNLEQLARDLEVSPFVRFVGHRPDAASLLHLIDLFWLASEFEGMSNSLMEAMACGKPVIVSDIPPNRELVQHDQTGYLISGGDSVGYAQYSRRLIESPDESRRIGQAAAQRMRDEFSVEKMVSRYAELLREEVLSAVAASANPSR